MPDDVNHPAHYTAHPSGVECIEITEHMPFNVGNAIKYLWRAGEKGSQIQDLRKAAWYVNREIARLEKASQPIVNQTDVLDKRPGVGIRVFDADGFLIHHGSPDAARG